MRSRTAVLAAMLAIAPLSAESLTSWCGGMRSSPRRRTTRSGEIVAAFTGKQVELASKRSGSLALRSRRRWGWANRPISPRPLNNCFVNRTRGVKQITARLERPTYNSVRTSLNMEAAHLST
jgi:hypothetical protein